LISDQVGRAETLDTIVPGALSRRAGRDCLESDA
jgi:hypothetical protein